MHYLTERFTEIGIEKAATTLGQIVTYAGENIPDGWLPCDGRMLRRRVYPELFKVIGIQYGDGDGSNTAFNLPDLVSVEAGVRHLIFVGMA
jgi:microcystin-dependent protein